MSRLLAHNSLGSLSYVRHLHSDVWVSPLTYFCYKSSNRGKQRGDRHGATRSGSVEGYVFLMIPAAMLLLCCGYHVRLLGSPCQSRDPTDSFVEPCQVDEPLALTAER